MGVLNIQRIMAAIVAAEAAALVEVAAHVVASARARAPVRKVFREAKGHRRKFRSLTPIERNLAIRRAEAYSGYNDYQRRRSVAYLRNYARAELRRPGSLNSLSKSRKLRILGTDAGNGFRARVDAVRSGRGGFSSATLNPLLTARGRYEVRSGRAVHREVSPSGSVRVQIGGRLKASIESEGVVSTGQGSTIVVAARAPYAKFVEFPTTHNAAQPFLLPALHDNRTRLKQVLAREVRKALGGRG
jgi:HK97 gp10 family phage protein